MKRIFFSCLAMLLGTVAGCGSSDKCASVTCGAAEACDSESGACVNKCQSMTCSYGATCDASVGMCVNPTAPTITTAPIDRMARPGVTTALINPFDLYKPQGTTVEMADVTKDRYNIDGNVSAWTTNWSTPLKLSLGIFDALDGVCGNQLAYGGASGLPLPNYTLLSMVLAGDAIQMDSSKTSCGQYLAVEMTALGDTTTANDCGGRTLDYDVIDVTYSELAAGAKAGVNDGPIGPNTTSLATFPFMAEPKPH